ncbi:MAG: hypothetical protein OXG85_14785 [Chloroflexi bacterium]|nr:hypothetical protein [Chloroflexota bacterium]
MKVIRLPLPSWLYRFNLLLAFVRRIAYPARLVVQGEALWRFTGGRLVSYRQEGGEIVISGARPLGDCEARIETISRHCLGLGRDLTAFYDFVEGDHRLRRVVEPVYGSPLFCTESVFEALITLIIEQHITWKNALRAQQTLMRLFDTGEAIEGATVYDFPTPPQVASAAPADLKPLKITNKRIDMIIAIAQAVAEGSLDLESIGRMDPPSAYDRLLAISGVGHWTANNALGRALGAYPYVSQNDVAMQAAVAHYFYDGARSRSAELVSDTLSEFGEYAGLIGHFALLRWVLERYPPISH